MTIDLDDDRRHVVHLRLKVHKLFDRSGQRLENFPGGSVSMGASDSPDSRAIGARRCARWTSRSTRAPRPSPSAW